MTGQRLLAPLPALVVALGGLGGREPVELQALEDAPHPGLRDRDVVVAGQVHRDLGGAEVVVLTQVDELADDLSPGGPGLRWGRLERSRSPSRPWAS